MRNIPAALLELLAREDTALITLVKLTLVSGDSYYYTDASQSIRYAGKVWRADCGLDVSAIRDAADALSQTATLEIGYADGMITEQMVRKGAIDGATHQVLIMDYRHPEAGAFEAFSGNLDRLTASSRYTFSVDLTGWQGRSYNINGVYSLKCRNIFCDAGCTLHIEDYSTPFTVTGSGDSGTSVGIDAAIADKFGDNGSVLWTGGANAGSLSRVATNLGQSITLVSSPGYDPLPGDTGVLRAGCDYFKATCKDKYNNLPNFQAEPSVPQGSTTSAEKSTTTTTVDVNKPPPATNVITWSGGMYPYG